MLKFIRTTTIAIIGGVDRPLVRVGRAHRERLVDLGVPHRLDVAEVDVDQSGRSAGPSRLYDVGPSLDGRGAWRCSSGTAFPCMAAHDGEDGGAEGWREG
ncbi:MAG TPA: hypothetical protein PJ982_12805 [Lacipirellulaceae bacterium]|nr:hypothetical protein [Lacipirellulaceae bacterium]